MWVAVTSLEEKLNRTANRQVKFFRINEVLWHPLKCCEKLRLFV